MEYLRKYDLKNIVDGLTDCEVNAVNNIIVGNIENTIRNIVKEQFTTRDDYGTKFRFNALIDRITFNKMTRMFEVTFKTAFVRINERGYLEYSKEPF